MICHSVVRLLTDSNQTQPSGLKTSVVTTESLYC